MGAGTEAELGSACPHQVTRDERVVLFGALVLLLASAGLGGADAESAGLSGSALRVHANAGSLGWMTLGALAVALGMLRGDHGRSGRGSRVGYWLAWLSVVVVAAFVCVDAVGSAEVSAGAATAVLLAVGAFVAWLGVVRQRTRAIWTVPRFGAAAALAVLMTGFALGAASAWTALWGHGAAAASFAAAQSAVVSVPFVMLVATAAAEWASAPPAEAVAATTAGLVQVGAFALAATATVAGVLSSNLALTEANTSLMLVGIAIFGVRVGPRLLTPGSARGGRVWLAVSVLALAVDAGLFVHTVFEVGAQRYASAGQVPAWLVFAVDHVTFAGVGTAALFGAIATWAGQTTRWLVADAAAAAGLVIGLAGIALGLGSGSAGVERASAAVLGLAIVVAIAIAGLRVAGLASPAAQKASQGDDHAVAR